MSPAYSWSAAHCGAGVGVITASSDDSFDLKPRIHQSRVLYVFTARIQCFALTVFGTVFVVVLFKTYM